MALLLALITLEFRGGVGSPFVITVDAGNSFDFCQYVNFARQYDVDIKKILERIIEMGAKYTSQGQSY